MLELLQKYGPAADTFISLLKDDQRIWLRDNFHHMAPFLQTEDGQAVITMLLEEFGKFVTAQDDAVQK